MILRTSRSLADTAEQTWRLRQMVAALTAPLMRRLMRRYDIEQAWEIRTRPRSKWDR